MEGASLDNRSIRGGESMDGVTVGNDVAEDPMTPAEGAAQAVAGGLSGSMCWTRTAAARGGGVHLPLQEGALDDFKWEGTLSRHP